MSLRRGTTKTRAAYDACARKACQCSNAPVAGKSASCRLCPQTTIAASRGVRLTAAVNTGNRKRSFQHVCARVTSRSSSCSVLLIYRPGSRTADASFFTELSDLLDRLMTLSDPIMIVGYLNIRMDRPDDPHCRRLHELLATYNLSCRVSSPTHDLSLIHI